MLLFPKAITTTVPRRVVCSGAAWHASAAQRRPGGAAVGVDALAAGERTRRVADPNLRAVPTSGLSAGGVGLCRKRFQLCSKGSIVTGRTVNR